MCECVSVCVTAEDEVCPKYEDEVCLEYLLGTLSPPHEVLLTGESLFFN